MQQNHQEPTPFDKIFINLDAILAKKKENYDLAQTKIAVKQKPATVVNKNSSPQNLKKQAEDETTTEGDTSFGSDPKEEDDPYDPEEVIRNQEGVYVSLSYQIAIKWRKYSNRN
jgi:hypothetical protein